MVDEEQRNLEVIRALNAAENAHDLDGISATQHEVMRGFLNGVERSGGRAGDRDTNERLFAALPDYRRTLEELFAAGTRVVARWRFTGTHRGDFLGIPPTGRTVEVAGCTIFELSDGKIAGSYIYFDLGSLLQSLSQ